MYPENFTELTGLLAVVVPLTIWIFSGLWAVKTRVEENRSQQWRRISELALLLYNKEGTSGQWAQMAAVSELSDVDGKNQREAATAILTQAQQHFAGSTDMSRHITLALQRLS